MVKIKVNSSNETEKLGEIIAEFLCGNETIAFFGGLGAGKTTFTRGLVRGLGSGDCVSSPTFAIVNEYMGKYKIRHYDMYRISSWEDLESCGFFDELSRSITVIEWSENIENALPDDTIKITIEKCENDTRLFIIEGLVIDDNILEEAGFCENACD